MANETRSPPPFLQRTMLVRLTLPVVIAGVLGPLVAGLAVFLYSLYVFIIDPSVWPPALADKFLLLAEVFITVIAVAYLGGVVIALLAGALVAIWMMWRPPQLIVIIAAAAAATVGYFAVVEPEAFMSADSTIARQEFIVTFALAIVAAVGCWFLTRRYVRPA